MNKHTKYNHSDKGQARYRRYDDSAKGRARKLKYECKAWVLGSPIPGRAMSRQRQYVKHLRLRSQRIREQLDEYRRLYPDLYKLVFREEE